MSDVVNIPNHKISDDFLKIKVDFPKIRKVPSDYHFTQKEYINCCIASTKSLITQAEFHLKHLNDYKINHL